MGGEIQNIERKQLAALNAPRCQFTRDDGSGCGSPALKGQPFCYFHSRTPEGRKRKRTEAAKPTACQVPPLSDDDAIRAAAMNVCRGLADKTLDSKRAGMLLYGLQIASSALRGSRLQRQTEAGITICADHRPAITRYCGSKWQFIRHWKAKVH